MIVKQMHGSLGDILWTGTCDFQNLSTAPVPSPLILFTIFFSEHAICIIETKGYTVSTHWDKIFQII